MGRIIGLVVVFFFVLGSAFSAVADDRNTQMSPTKPLMRQNVQNLRIKPNAEKYVPVKQAGSDVIKFIPQNQISPGDQPVPLMLPGHAANFDEYIKRISNLEEDVSGLKDLVKTQTMVIEYLKKELESFTAAQSDTSN